jgi:murein DD-endopeptidase MepM/ murein hydrolase activator NlpD
MVLNCRASVLVVANMPRYGPIIGGSRTRMYTSAEPGILGQTGNTALLSMADRVSPFGRAKNVRTRQHSERYPKIVYRIADWFADIVHSVSQWAHDVDLTPDLAVNVGSRTWWRGLATLVGLLTALLATAPGISPLAISTPAMAAKHWDEARALTIMPRALGSDSGKRMAASDVMQPLASAPERPSINMVAMLGEGDSLARVLERSGVSGSEANTVARMVAAAISLGDISAGTRMDLILGRRASADIARPLDAMSFRARFDLRLEIERVNGALTMRHIPIMVDDTPLRLRGRVGDSLYRSARAAGATPEAIETYLRVIAQQLSIGRDVQASDEFDLIFEHRRAETGEVQTGNLLYAGLVRDGRIRLQMLKWTSGDTAQWLEASGVGKASGGMAAPTAGRLTSNFGMRRHPILGYMRMHAGVDYGAPYGSPVYAVTDGVVTLAGRSGGYGNFIKLSHGGGMGSGYGHLSRIVVRAGQSVKRGQIIGNVGSSGMSTGPHLHFEIYRNGAAVNPLSVKFVERAQLSGKDLAEFKALLARLSSITPGAAAAPAQKGPSVVPMLQTN